MKTLNHFLSPQNKTLIQNVPTTKRDYAGFLQTLRIKLKDHRFVEFSAMEFCKPFHVHREIFSFMLNAGMLEKKKVGNLRYAYKSTLKFGELNVHNIANFYNQRIAKRNIKSRKQKVIITSQPITNTKKVMLENRHMKGDYSGLVNYLKQELKPGEYLKGTGKELMDRFGHNFIPLSVMSKRGYLVNDRNKGWRKTLLMDTLTPEQLKEFCREYMRDSSKRSFQNRKNKEVSQPTLLPVQFSTPSEASIEQSLRTFQEKVQATQTKSITLSKAVNNAMLRLTLNLEVEGEGDYTQLFKSACDLIQ